VRLCNRAMVIREREVPATVALLKENNVNIVSNMSLDEALVNMIFEPEETLARPEYGVAAPK
jgi:hypothetical protein